MNKQDDAFLRQFGLILGVLIIFAFGAYFLGSNIATSAVQEAAATEAATQARIAPIGKVNALAPAPEKAPAQAPMQAAAAPAVTAPAVTAPAVAPIAPATIAAAPTPAIAPAATTPAADDGRPAEEVYKMVCMACHVIGIANAPKTGDKAAWSARMTQGGVPALVASVIKGKGAMPPKAGNPSVTEAEITRTVEWFLKEAGIDAQ